MEDKIWTCIVKRLSGTETEESAAVLDEWLESDTGHIEHYLEVKKLWELTALIQPEVPEEDAAELIHSYQQEEPAEAPRRMLFWKYGIAAALTGALLLAGLQLFHPDKPQPVEWVIHTTEPGRMDTVTLPDQSTVCLNAGTEIRFRKNFSSEKIRDVQLKGEAYFEVHHDKTHPFVVTSGDLKTTVYGTSFNIRAYPGEAEMSVAVNSGKVGVQHVPSGDKAIFLLPNDKLSLRNGQLVRSTQNKADVSSWAQGEMIFEQMPLQDVLATIARRYRVAIETGTEDYSECKLTARFKDQPLSTILKTLNISMNITARQVNDTIYLKGGNCM